ncbi:MAG: peroxiredoxin family protein [Nitrosopumilaceae archaeon]
MKSRRLVYAIAVMAIVGITAAIFAISQQSQTKAESNSPYSISSSPSLAAPAFALPSTTGNKISLSDYAGKKNVLLYFQEGVMCAPCWKQIEDIQKGYDLFKSLDIEVVTITVDPLNALIKESNKRAITLPVLDDGDLTISKAYGVLDYSMHPGSRPGHTFILVGKDGDIIWRKDYYPAGGSSGEGMNMEMNTNSDGRMYVPVDELLREIYKISYRLFPNDTTQSEINSIYNDGKASLIQNNTALGSTMVDHSMCITPIHMHADFKIYLNGNSLNLAQRKYMDQSMDVHFHPTVKVNPDDVPGIPFADMIHIHKENMTIRDFINTLDFDADILKMLNDKQTLQVYANGDLQQEGLDYVMQDKDRILVSYGNEIEIDKQIESVTTYAIIGKDKNPSLFGGC